MADASLLNTQTEKKTWGEWFSENKMKIFWWIAGLAAVAGAYYYWFHYRPAHTHASLGVSDATISDGLKTDDFLVGPQVNSASPDMPRGELNVKKVKFF